MNLGIIYFLIHMSFAVFWGLLYYLNNIFILKHPKLAQNIGFLDKKYLDYKKKKPHTFYYCLWWSLVTQTTVGYNYTANDSKYGNDNQNLLTFANNSNKSGRVINIMQLISIFLTIGICAFIEKKYKN